MIVAAFYTKEYKDGVKTLRESAKKFKLKFDAMEITDSGNWRRNLSYRPTFILQMLNKHQEPILALDADALIRQSPDILLADPPCDIAFFYSPKWDLASGGTLYFGNTVIARKILKAWIALEEKYWQTTMNDQFTLRQVVCGESHWGLHSTRLLLPASYLRITKMKDSYFNVEPVIEHLIVGANHSVRQGGHCDTLGLPRKDRAFVTVQRIKNGSLAARKGQRPSKPIHKGIPLAYSTEHHPGAGRR